LLSHHRARSCAGRPPLLRRALCAGPAQTGARRPAIAAHEGSRRPADYPLRGGARGADLAGAAVIALAILAAVAAGWGAVAAGFAGSPPGRARSGLYAVAALLLGLGLASAAFAAGLLGFGLAGGETD